MVELAERMMTADSLRPLSGRNWDTILNRSVKARHDKMVEVVERLMIADSFRTTADDEKEDPVGAQA